MAEDAFGSLLQSCEYSSSQEEQLRRLPFVGESEDNITVDSSGSGGIPVDSTGILMVSAPDSLKDEGTPRDDFHTPPEESLVHLGSSDEQRRVAVDHRADKVIDGARGGDGVDVGSATTGSDGAVDLPKDLDLGSSEVKLAQRIDGVRLSEGSESRQKKVGVSKRDAPSEDDLLAETPTKKLKFSGPNLSSETPNACVGIVTQSIGDASKSVEIVEKNILVLTEPRGQAISDKRMASEVLESEFEKCDETVKLVLSDEVIGEAVGHGIDKLEVCTGEVHSNGGGDSCANNADDIEKFKYVCSTDNAQSQTKGLEGWRELPLSICRQDENAKQGLGSNPSLLKNKWVKHIQAAMEMLSKGCDDSLENLDLLDIAKSRGMTFPQPRWWRPAGYGEG